jgi:hypothetical protein
MKPFRRQKPIVSFVASNSITRPITRAGSTWSRLIGVLRGQCLHRRIGERNQLVSQIAAWGKQRNKARARIKWMFTVERARTQIGARLARDAEAERLSPAVLAGTQCRSFGCFLRP